MSTLRRLFRAAVRLYERLFQRRLDARTRALMETIESVPALRHVSTSALHTLAEAVHRRTYRRGEIIYHEGDPGLGLYIIEEGCVRLSVETEPGRAQELRQLRAPAVFGVLPLLGDFRRLETATTMTEVRVLGFFRPDLKNIIKRHPKAGVQLTTAVARTVATQHVELIHVLTEQQGRDTALQIHAEATSKAAE